MHGWDLRWKFHRTVLGHVSGALDGSWSLCGWRWGGVGFLGLLGGYFFFGLVGVGLLLLDLGGSVGVGRGSELGVGHWGGSGGGCGRELRQAILALVLL